MDETWLHHYEPKTKLQLNECSIAAHPASKITSINVPWISSRLDFWDEVGILLIDYLQKGQNINAECFPFVLVQLKDIL